MKTEPYKGIADIYDEVRPSYPDKLIKDIISITGINHSDKLLEIGAGTGKATMLFADRGLNIKAIEIGEDMAELLQEKCTHFSNVSIDVISFEEWKPSENIKYNMIYCAQAFHWIDKNIKFKKCHDLLKDDGHLVLFWYNPCKEKTPQTMLIDEKISNIIQKYSNKNYNKSNSTERRTHDGISENDKRRKEIIDSDLFNIIAEKEYTLELQNTSTQYLNSFKSVTEFASILDGMDQDIIRKMDNEIIDVIDREGGLYNLLFNYILFISQKK